jgi:hypothetical protein
MKRAPSAAPTPMPALAPVESVLLWGTAVGLLVLVAVFEATTDVLDVGTSEVDVLDIVDVLLVVALKLCASCTPSTTYTPSPASQQSKFWVP